MSVRVLHFRVNSTSGLHRVDDRPDARRYYLTGEKIVLEAHRVREFAIVEVDATYTGSAVDLDYQLAAGGAWASVQDSLATGVRYTHLTTNNVTYNQANQTFLPIHALGLELHDATAWSAGTADVYLILWLQD